MIDHAWEGLNNDIIITDAPAIGFIPECFYVLALLILSMIFFVKILAPNIFERSIRSLKQQRLCSQVV